MQLSRLEETADFLKKLESTIREVITLAKEEGTPDNLRKLASTIQSFVDLVKKNGAVIKGISISNPSELFS